jgi:hypothetical protein
MIVLPRLAFLMLCLFISACNRESSGTDHSRPTKTEVVWKHGSKIVIQPILNKNEIYLTQSEIKIQPTITAKSQAISGKHSFEFGPTASYWDSPPKSVTFDVLHNTPTKTGWRFPPRAQLIVIADGRRIELPICTMDFPDPNKPSKKCYQSELKKDLPTDAEYYETLIMDIPFETFSSISESQSVQMQIGQAQFSLPRETIAAFKDFTDIASQ